MSLFLKERLQYYRENSKWLTIAYLKNPEDMQLLHKYQLGLYTDEDEVEFYIISKDQVIPIGYAVVLSEKRFLYELGNTLYFFKFSKFGECRIYHKSFNKDYIVSYYFGKEGAILTGIRFDRKKALMLLLGTKGTCSHSYLIKLGGKQVYKIIATGEIFASSAGYDWNTCYCDFDACIEPIIKQDSKYQWINYDGEATISFESYEEAKIFAESLED